MQEAWRGLKSPKLPIYCSTILAALLILAGVSASRAYAQSATATDDEVNRIAHQLYCPVCENTPLDVCPTEACRQWRDLIRLKLEQGWTEAQIKQYFVVQYGARVLSEPPATGLNWLVYVLPPLLILLGAFVLLRILSAWTQTTRKRAASVEDKEAPDLEYVSRLEDELRKRK